MAFHAEYEGNIYFYVQQFLRKLEWLLQIHLSPFIAPYHVLSQYIPFYEVSKTEYKKCGIIFLKSDFNEVLFILEL